MSCAKISIIIPIYNVEKYLAECLDFCINQTLENIEIICVDNCSYNNSIKILKEYQAKDSRIKIFSHEENKNLEGSTSSRIGAGGDIENLVKIDDEITEYVTFIKMDVEGAELESLKGATSILIKDKPRLAICIYHKKEDLSEIPQYLLSVVPEYRFVVRHYNAKPWETVLYAYVNN